MPPKTDLYNNENIEIEQVKTLNTVNSICCFPNLLRNTKYQTTPKLVTSNLSEEKLHNLKKKQNFSNRLRKKLTRYFSSESSYKLRSVTNFASLSSSFESFDSDEKTSEMCLSDPPGQFHYCDFPSGKTFTGTIDELRVLLATYIDPEDKREYTSIGKWFVPRPNYINETIKNFTQTAVQNLYQLFTDPNMLWTTYKVHKKYTIETHADPQTKRTIGKSICEFTPSKETPLTMDFVSDAMWQEHYKQEYDEFSENVYVSFKYSKYISVILRSAQILTFLV